MRLLYNGLPYFTEKLVNELTTFDSKNQFVFLNTYQSKWAQIKFLLSLPFCNKVISMNGVSDKSGSLSWAMRFKKPLIMQWQGTDVLLLRERIENKAVLNTYLDYATHFTDAPWLQKELDELGIEAKLLSFKSLKPITTTTQYSEINILTYLGKGRESFYGWEVILEAMRSFQNIQLYVMGTDGEGLEKLPNITFLGWADKNQVIEHYKKCPIFVRMTEHDGYSLSIMEALSYGLEVIWNNPHEKTLLATNSVELTKSIIQLNEKITERQLQSNTENQNWIKENLDRDKVLKNYIETVTK